MAHAHSPVIDLAMPCFVLTAHPETSMCPQMNTTCCNPPAEKEILKATKKEYKRAYHAVLEDRLASCQHVGRDFYRKLSPWDMYDNVSSNYVSILAEKCHSLYGPQNFSSMHESLVNCMSRFHDPVWPVSHVFTHSEKWSYSGTCMTEL